MRASIYITLFVLNFFLAHEAIAKQEIIQANQEVINLYK